MSSHAVRNIEMKLEKAMSDLIFYQNKYMKTKDESSLRRIEELERKIETLKQEHSMITRQYFGGKAKTRKSKKSRRTRRRHSRKH